MIKTANKAAILLLAAGASSRMRGGDKLLETVQGQSLLATMVQRASATGCNCFVTIPSRSHPRTHHIGDATAIVVTDWKEGMSASIRAGVQALPQETDRLLIQPADMPEITTEDFLKVLATQLSTPNEIIRATSVDGKPGHPVVFPRSCFKDLLSLKGDQGARSLLKARNVGTSPLPGNRALVDLDTPEAWAKWRADQHRTMPTT